MAIFKGAVLVCQICGATFKVPRCRAETATTCSHACAVKYKAYGLMKEKVPLVCKACGITYFAHKSQSANRTYCSYACKDSHQAYRDTISARTRGANNAAWKGGETMHSDGYVYVHTPSHPYSSGGYVLQHRLAAEQHLIATNSASPCLVRVDGTLYLNPDLVVHHKDFNRANNNIENLQIMTNADHTRLHSLLRRQH